MVKAFWLQYTFYITKHNDLHDLLSDLVAIGEMLWFWFLGKLPLLAFLTRAILIAGAKMKFLYLVLLPLPLPDIFLIFMKANQCKCLVSIKYAIFLVLIRNLWCKMCHKVDLGHHKMDLKQFQMSKQLHMFLGYYLEQNKHFNIANTISDKITMWTNISNHNQKMSKCNHSRTVWKSLSTMF